MSREAISMKRIFPSFALLLFFAHVCSAQDPTKFKIHDLNRPLPPIITPGTASTQDAPGHTPSDAVVLFDGKDLSQWTDKDGKPAKWKVENGYMEVAAGTGYISTREAFGDCQLHAEFAEPSPGVGESQERGNSGVFLMGLYEIQVLDSYENKTYADGQAAAVYGQYPPLVNASRPPAQWQTYDIIFHGPRFKDSKLTRPARVTVLHNGVLVQDNVELTGPTAHGERPPYKPGPDKLPLQLQDHSYPVRFRNIWIRELHE
jgi:membrane-bound lytic murein transglycosylase